MSSKNETSLSENAEEYLEVLYKLSLKERPVKTTKIAKKLGVTPASATQMIKKLESKGYLEYSPYKGAVSYTHLDVYKRQDMTWGLFSKHFRPQEVNMRMELVERYWKK